MHGSTPATTWTTVRDADGLQPKRKLRVGALDVACLLAGPPEGRCVLWVHGFPSNAHLWRDCLPVAAAAGVRSIAPDLAGLGETAAPQSTDFGFEGQARILDALLEGMDVRSVQLVGEGIGATVCMALARRLWGRGRVGAMALLDAPPIPTAVPLRAWPGSNGFPRPAAVPSWAAAAALARSGAGDSVLRAL
ncbi:MAG: alpha/beta fold hydrolase, partial [Gemmatimonadetes bacterium]|nr:alpha/beta fold hydrolase [Gemmatimonadota bacterium]